MFGFRKANAVKSQQWICVVYLLGLLAAILLPTSVMAGVFDNIPEATDDGYVLIYDLDIPDSSQIGLGMPNYSVDNSHTFLSGDYYDRVGYYLELEKGGQTQYAWASMDPFTKVPNNLGIPHTQLGGLVPEKCFEYERRVQCARRSQRHRHSDGQYRILARQLRHGKRSGSARRKRQQIRLRRHHFSRRRRVIRFDADPQSRREPDNNGLQQMGIRRHERPGHRQQPGRGRKSRLDLYAKRKPIHRQTHAGTGTAHKSAAAAQYLQRCSRRRPTTKFFTRPTSKEMSTIMPPAFRMPSTTPTRLPIRSIESPTIWN